MINNFSFNSFSLSKNCCNGLRIYQSHAFLHLIDMDIHLLTATFTPDKNKDTMLRVISAFGQLPVYSFLDKILVQNGKEFANKKFTETSDYLSIQTTAAESPWNNAIVERNNPILTNMRNRISSDTQCTLDLVLR